MPGLERNRLALDSRLTAMRVPHPQFPDFTPLELGHRAEIAARLRDYRPVTSELTFTNLFMWRFHYRPHWCLHERHLLVVFRPEEPEGFALPPIGPPSRAAATRDVLQWLTDSGARRPRVERADRRLVAEIEAESDGGRLPLLVKADRDQFDYVYRTDALARLSGRSYAPKRRHVERFQRGHPVVYELLATEHVDSCLSVLDEWCRQRRCEEDPDLEADRRATHEAVVHHEDLGLTGGVILRDHEVQAFSLGEMLNDQTAVVHVEKANPAIPGCFAVINQEFARHAWPTVPYLNREQDLGQPGLREAKLSYRPLRLVEKFTVELGS